MGKKKQAALDLDDLPDPLAELNGSVEQAGEILPARSKGKKGKKGKGKAADWPSDDEAPAAQAAGGEDEDGDIAVPAPAAGAAKQRKGKKKGKGKAAAWESDEEEQAPAAAAGVLSLTRLLKASSLTRHRGLSRAGCPSCVCLSLPSHGSQGPAPSCAISIFRRWGEAGAARQGSGPAAACSAVPCRAWEAALHIFSTPGSLTSTPLTRLGRRTLSVPAMSLYGHLVHLLSTGWARLFGHALLVLGCSMLSTHESFVIDTWGVSQC